MTDIHRPQSPDGTLQLIALVSAASGQADQPGRLAMASGGVQPLVAPSVSGAVQLDGSTGYLETDGPVLATTASFTVAAWVRLDRERLRDGLSMLPDEWAWTAASQDSPTHSPFYLGVRKFPGPNDPPGPREPFWNLTLSPVDGSVTGTLEWRHAHVGPIGPEMIDRWLLLVGVCDVPQRQARLYVPGLGESLSQAPEEWPFWQADGPLQVGRARWLGNPVDFWPGSIGPVGCFSGAATASDVAWITSVLPGPA